MTHPKHEQAASIIRDRIAAGTLRPGRPAPSGWENADKALSARGELLRAHDAYRAAVRADPAPASAICPPPTGPPP
jgi:hypothetical protein